jgi:integrase
VASEKLNFTRSSLSAILPPVKGRVYYRDEQARSLILDVQASGTKTFQVYRKADGIPTRVTLGRFNSSLPESRDYPTGTDPLTLIGNTAELNVRMARKLADAVNASLDRGINPAQNARNIRTQHSQELTLRQAFDRYYADHLIPHGKRTANDLSNDFARYLGKVAPGQKKLHGKEKGKSAGAVDWELRKLSSISQADIRKLMISLKDSIGSRTANKVFVLLRSIYNKIIAWQLYTGQNPCSGIEKFKENSRERFVTGDELPRFLAAVEKIDHQDFKDFVFLSLFTAARRANVLAMRWQDINFHAGIWTVPGEFSKNGSALTIPITKIVLELLERRKTELTADVAIKSPTETPATTSPYVFPASSGEGHMSPPNKRWKALLTEAKVEDLRLHDLRRSFGSWAAMGNISLAIIGGMLGHKSSEATKVYARMHSDPIREAMELTTATILEHGMPTSGHEKPLPPLPPSE